MTGTIRAALLVRLAVVVGLSAVVVGCGAGSDELEPLEAVQVVPPVLQDVQPRTVASGDTLTITGRFLDGAFASGLFGDVSGVLALEDPAPTPTRSYAVVPEGLTPGEYDFRYQAYGRESEQVVRLTVRPGLSAISHNTAYAGQELVVTGTYQQGANSYRLELLPQPMGAPIEIPVTASSLSQLVWVVPPTLPLGQYALRVTNLSDNSTLASRVRVTVATPPADSSYLAAVGPTNKTATPDNQDQYRLVVANGPDSVKGYNILLVRPNATASSVVGITTRIDSVQKMGSDATVFFSVRRDLTPGGYNVRVVLPRRTFWVYAGMTEIVIN